MKKITIYESENGCRFNTEQEALLEDSYIIKCAFIFKDWKPSPDGHGTSVAQSKEVFFKAFRELLKLCNERGKHQWIDLALETPENDMENLNIRMTYVSRIVGEMPGNELNRHVYRLSCVDNNFNEWDQPYYKNESNKLINSLIS